MSRDDNVWLTFLSFHTKNIYSNFNLPSVKKIKYVELILFIIFEVIFEQTRAIHLAKPSGFHHANSRSYHIDFKLRIIKMVMATKR